jgi:hypothetical protein
MHSMLLTTSAKIQVDRAILLLEQLLTILMRKYKGFLKY